MDPRNYQIGVLCTFVAAGKLWLGFDQHHQRRAHYTASDVWWSVQERTDQLTFSGVAFAD